MDGLSVLALVILPVIFAASVVLDVYGYYVRSTVDINEQAQVLAFGNWVIYIARVLGIGFSFLLAICFEMGVLSDVSLVFCIGFCLSLVMVFFVVKEPVAERFLCKLFHFVFYIPFATMSSRLFWRPLHIGLGMRGGAMFISAGFMYWALLLPFIIAKYFPDVRMTAVFVGQIMSFVSTVISLSYLEPRLMKFLDEKSDVRHVDSMVFGRVLLVFCCAIFSIFWVVL